MIIAHFLSDARCLVLELNVLILAHVNSCKVTGDSVLGTEDKNYHVKHLTIVSPYRYPASRGTSHRAVRRRDTSQYKTYM